MRNRLSKIPSIVFWGIVVINIMISFMIHPMKNSFVADNLLTTESLSSGNPEYVYCEGDRIVYQESDETCVAYANIDIARYDYLIIDLNAQAVNDQCQISVDISGNNLKWSGTNSFHSEFLSDVDANSIRVSGKLELDRDHSDMGVIRVMNAYGAPAIVSEVHVSGWKYYRLSNYSILMLIIFSLMIMYTVQKKIRNSGLILRYFAEIIVAFASVCAIVGGLANDAAGACSSMTNLFGVIYDFLVSDSQYTWMITVSFILYSYVMIQIQKEYLHTYSIVSSYVFSFFILSGYFYGTKNVFFELYQQKYFWMECLFLMMGLALFIQNILKILHIFIKYCIAHSDVMKWSRKKCFWVVFVIVTVVWTPHLLIRYPAAIHWDSAVQIHSVLQDTVNTFWSVTSTLLMGKSAQLGNQLLGSYNAGIFLYALIQTLICAAIFAYGISLLIEFRISKIYIWIATFICSCMPIFSSYTTSVSKDVPFSNLVMLYLLMLFESTKIKSDISWKYGALFSAVAVSVILMSNKGIFYVVVGAFGLFVFWIVQREAKYGRLFVGLITSLLLTQAIQIGINNTYEYSQHLSTTICQPLQELGYYAIKYEDEWDEEAKELFNQFVIYEGIEDSYNMGLADGVFLALWRNENKHSAKDKYRLLKLWISGFIKHPDCFVDATLRCNYGFYYPDTKQWWNYSSGYYIGAPNVPGVELPFTYSDYLQNASRKLSKVILIIEDLPILYLFNNVAISVWIQIYIFLYLLFEKKWQEWFCILVSLVSFGLCLIGPTYYNGGARYALLSVFFNIFIVGYWMSDRYSQEGAE